MNMFKYTRSAIDMVINDLRRYYRIFKLLTFLVMFSYFVFAAIVGLGQRWVNISLASVMLIYQIIDFFVVSKSKKKYLRRSYRWIKITIRAISLAILIYGIYEAASNVSALNIIMATLMIIFWLAQVILEILLEIFEDKKDLLVEAVKEDFATYKEKLSKPVNAVKKVTNFLTGKPANADIVDIEEREESKEIKKLKKFMENKKEK